VSGGVRSKLDLSLHLAGILLALCNMRTLYLRNVPDEVVDRLERMAKREGISVNAVAIRELAEASRRIDNAALLESLPDYNVPISEILEDLDRARAERC
jgi:transcriptional regulator with XRE-family HTH domain